MGGHLPALRWYAACSLPERVALVRSRAIGGAPSLEQRESAARRRNAWLSQPPFSDSELLVDRLVQAGIGEEEFLAVLVRPDDFADPTRLNAPGWARDLAEALAAFEHPTPNGPASDGFLTVARPLIDQAVGRLQTHVGALVRSRGRVPFDPAVVVSLLLPSLLAELERAIVPAMTLELNVARLRGLLTGDSPTARYQSFVRSLRDRHAAASFLAQYPVLARDLTERADSWVQGGVEFLERLCDDWPDIVAGFSLSADPGPLAAVEAHLGDRHCRGRSVAVARFRSGLAVVYKPRSLAVDLHFQELLRWINGKLGDPAFRTLEIIDRPEHGWVEYVAHRACETAEQVVQFYQRQGGYLAILHLLHATDFHSTNLIASGEHPVLVDLETLFHPVVEGGGEHIGPADDAMARSVLRTGLLPQPLWLGDDSDAFDRSGLAARDGQLTPFALPRPQATGTDEMRIVPTRVPVPGRAHLPTLHGRAVDPVQYVHAVERGFARVYRLLQQERRTLQDTVLPRFLDDRVRVVLRATLAYTWLLTDSRHPDVLTDALDRDRLFDRLWAEVPRRPSLRRTVLAECEDLRRGDVPLFTTTPGSRDMGSSTGERLHGFLEESGYESVRRRLMRLGEGDRQRQQWYIGASLATAGARRRSRSGGRPGGDRHLRRAAEHQQLLVGARAVGDRLAVLAARDHDEAAWIGLSLTRREQWKIGPVGPDLYDGTAGIALFLARLGAVTQQERYSELARAGVVHLRRQMRNGGGPAGIGAFAGWGGLIYVLSHLGVLWAREDLIALAHEIVERLPPQVEGDDHHDLTGGAAGCIAGLLSLQEIAPSDAVRAVMRACLRHLEERAEPMRRGIGWRNAALGNEPLAGFAHGASGVAWALVRLASVSDDPAARRMALAALDYERSLFEPESGNWADLRDRTQLRHGEHSDNRFMVAWCHGAAGIGLSRVLLSREFGDPGLRAELRVAIETTLRDGFGDNHCLCHGDLGNAELLAEAGRYLGDSALLVQAREVAGDVMKSTRHGGWICGTRVPVQTPGLMTGLAGIGYGLLRLAEPEIVPSVLLLAPASHARSPVTARAESRGGECVPATATSPTS